MHRAWLSRFASRGGELEKARRAVCAASVGTSSRQMVQHDGDIVEPLDFVRHGSLFSLPRSLLRFARLDAEARESGMRPCSRLSLPQQEAFAHDTTLVRGMPV